MSGKIRVGTRVYSKGTFTDPDLEGYTPIVTLTKSSPYGSLSPYLLETPNGILLENYYQFSKVYEKVPTSIQRKAWYDSTIIWNHPAETHVEDGQPNRKYFRWRRKNMAAQDPVRWPVGKAASRQCLFSIHEDDLESRLNYVESRKQIYLRSYLEAVVKEDQFKELQDRLAGGENLLIIEVDGPHQESLSYYVNTYGVSELFFQHSTVQATKRNLKILINDTKHPFGHGYCLAAALLGITEEELS